MGSSGQQDSRFSSGTAALALVACSSQTVTAALADTEAALDANMQARWHRDQNQ